MNVIQVLVRRLIKTVALFPVFLLFFISNPLISLAIGGHSYITTQNGKGRFPLSVSGHSAPLYISSNDYWGAIRALKDLQTDIQRVTNAKPELFEKNIPKAKYVVLTGTIGKSHLIDKLIREKKLNVNGITGQWEAFSIQVVRKPLPGINSALVIAGSDMLGTIYGIYDLSEKIGVSPWYWWDNVPPQHHNALYIKPGTYKTGPPSVKYRGIFPE